MSMPLMKRSARLPLPPPWPAWSRRGDDMRVTLLDEFAGKAGKDVIC